MNEAEKLYKQMEDKLAKAKSITLNFEVGPAAENQKRLFKGSLIVAEGNKLRFTYRGNIEEKAEEVTTISDGKKWMILPAVPELEQKEIPPPKDLEGTIRKALCQQGMMLSGLIIATPDGFGPWRVSHFKLGKKEKVGDRQAQAVEYRLRAKDDEPVTVVVWIDVETKVPLKRLFAMKGEGKDMSVTETYRDVKLDGKIDPKKFELPKPRKE
jgi:outer membrane lipoprotein-sorting protein